MDRIAVISDIHGNIPALEAVLNDISNRQVKKIICLGDLVGKGPCPDVAIDIIREKCETVLMGNWDDMVTRPSDFELMSWARNKIGEERVDYLRNLPFSVDFFISGRLVRLLHASPQSVHHRVHCGSPVEKLHGMFGNTELTGNNSFNRKPDIVGYGDIHGTYIMNFEELDNRVVFNAGSVGNPLDSTLASYAIVEGIYDQQEHSSFSINFVRVPYDVELAIHQARESNMPGLEPYIIELKTARYRGRGK
ncbi:MAG: metallophosphoesterase family protein [Clostridia bacterium]